MNKVRVANLNIAIKNVDQNFFNYRLRKYIYNDFEKPDLTIRVDAFDMISKPEGKVIKQIGDAFIIRTDRDKYCRYLTDRKTGNIFNAIYYDDSYSEIEINLKKIPESGFSLTDYEYMYTGFAFSDRLTMSGGAVLHGSGLAYNNQGIVFSANSGTGKSTHTQLWKECFSDKVVIVNDDKPAVRFYDGIPYIFGTPWSGKSDLNESIQVQLKAIIFIKRSETNRIELLNKRDGIYSLMSQISRPYYDEKIGLKTIDVIDKIIQTVPVYRLYCNISQEAVKVVFDQLIKEGLLI